MAMVRPLKLIQRRGAADILVTLLEEGELNVSGLSEEAGVGNGTIQRRLRELRESALVEEKIRKSENNRLEKAYSLTGTGRVLSERLISVKEVRI